MPRRSTFVIYQDAKSEWRWKLKAAGNSKIIADSGEGYKTLQGVKDAVERIREIAPVATVKIFK